MVFLIIYLNLNWLVERSEDLTFEHLLPDGLSSNYVGFMAKLTPKAEKVVQKVELT